jgi:hypothetical protein
MIVYVLFVHKKSVSERKVCNIFIKNIKFKKTQKSPFLVGFFRCFFGFFFGGFFGWVFLLPTLLSGGVLLPEVSHLAAPGLGLCPGRVPLQRQCLLQRPATRCHAGRVRGSRSVFIAIAGSGSVFRLGIRTQIQVSKLDFHFEILYENTLKNDVYNIYKNFFFREEHKL